MEKKSTKTFRNKQTSLIRADVTPIKAVKPKIEKVTSLKMLYFTIFKRAGEPYGGMKGDHNFKRGELLFVCGLCFFLSLLMLILILKFPTLKCLEHNFWFQMNDPDVSRYTR